jgi:predicted O-methyltransferase YrrM
LDTYRHDLRSFFQRAADSKLVVLAATRQHIELYRSWMEARIGGADVVWGCLQTPGPHQRRSGRTGFSDCPTNLGDTCLVAVDLGLLSSVQEMRRKLAELGPSEVRGEGDFDRVSIPDRDGDALRDLLLAENARVVIEVGLAYGGSALAIAEALVSRGPDGAAHVIVDAFQDHFHEAGWNAIAATGLTGVCSLRRDRSQLALPRLVAEGVVADAAFVDGSHIFHNVFVDLAFLRELVRPGGLIILDDCEWPSVATAVRYFEVNAGWRPEAIEKTTRLRAYRLPDPRIEPRFESFEPFGLDSAH